MSLIKSRKSSSWAPNILKAEKKELQTAIASLNQKSIQSTMEIGKFMDDSYKYALEQLKQNNFDA